MREIDGTRERRRVVDEHDLSSGLDPSPDPSSRDGTGTQSLLCVRATLCPVDSPNRCVTPTGAVLDVFLVRPLFP